MTAKIIWSCDINPLWRIGVIWRYRSVSTSARVIACCLAAPSHYPIRYWLITSGIVQRYSSGGNIKYTINHHQYYPENDSSKIPFRSPRSQWVNIPPISVHEYIMHIVYDISQCELTHPSAVSISLSTLPQYIRFWFSRHDIMQIKCLWFPFHAWILSSSMTDQRK